MKVYQHGNTDRYKETRIICFNPECACDFSYLNADLSSGVTYNFNTNSLIVYKYVACPECNQLMIIESEELADASSEER